MSSRKNLKIRICEKNPSEKLQYTHGTGNYTDRYKRREIIQIRLTDEEKAALQKSANAVQELKEVLKKPGV